MSRLDELIREYCPNGVEFKKIKDEYIRLKGTPITAGKMKEIENPDGEIRIFAGGKTVINANEEDIPKANITRVPALLVQSRGVIDFVFYDKPFTFKNEMWAYTHKNVTSIRFLYHVLKNNAQYFRDAASGMGSLPQISLKVTEDFVIPVPPLPVQEEIVRILDSFTQLTAELQAELQARKKQYEYYREHLISNGATHLVALKDLCNIKGRIGFRGYTRNDIVPEGNGAISFSPGNISNETLFFNDRTYISWEKYYESPEIMIYEGDILLCKTGSTLGKVAIVENLPEKATINPQLVVLKDILCNPRYLKYVIGGYSFQNEMQSRKGLGSVPNISQKEIGNIMIPLHEEQEQNRIVEILDNLSKLCNDISAGLPAEIEARQKQYEYYRDKLLTFQELS